MHELIQSEIQSDIISEKKFVTSGGSVPFPFCSVKYTPPVPFSKVVSLTRTYNYLIVLVKLSISGNHN